MQDLPFSDQIRRIGLRLIVLITVILSGWALRATGTFMIPVICSIFLALLVGPLDRSIVSRVPARFGWVGHVVAMGAIVLSLLVFVALLWVSAQQVMARYPMPTMVDALLPQFGGQGEGGTASNVSGGSGQTTSPTDTTGETASQTEQATQLWPQIKAAFSGAGDSIAVRIMNWASTMASDILLAAGTTLTVLVLIFFLTLIMLIERVSWRVKLETVLGSTDQRTAMRSVTIIADRLRRYLVARAILGVLTAGLYSVWLWLFRIDLLVVWALLAFLFNFVPTFGSMITGGLVVTYAFIQKDAGTAAI
ncbi:AI-2E family transporter, partial [Loktanella sp. DJP18]|uniref:AI-2E family transporter n=1 Tax=Loktanella sp. DJP18 TaxID=3409788 RepID=UPI003BB6D887